MQHHSSSWSACFLPEGRGQLDCRLGSPFVLPEGITGRLTIDASGAVIAARGDTADAKIETGFHGVLMIMGDLVGTHDLRATRTST